MSRTHTMCVADRPDHLTSKRLSRARQVRRRAGPARSGPRLRRALILRPARPPPRGPGSAALSSSAMPSVRHARTAERSLDPVLDFMRLLWTIEHGLQRMSKRMENVLGITGPQRLVLRVVGRYPDISAS